ncbi:hypothetical protein ES708_17903 [subsurface metagenome]
MTNVKDHFSGNFLKAEDCKGGEIVEFLGEGDLEEIKTPEGKMKSVMNYQVDINGAEKTFTPNKSNGNIFMEAWGEDDAKWVGKKFKITLAPVLVFGKKKMSIIAEPQDVVPVKKI